MKIDTLWAPPNSCPKARKGCKVDGRNATKPSLPSSFARPEDVLRHLLLAYLDRSAKKGTPEAELHTQAFDTVWKMAKEDPERCWDFLEVSLCSGLGDADLAFISAGPFEDLLGYHGTDFIDRIETKARQDRTMRYLIATVWKGGMRPDIWDRVQRIRARLNIVPQ